MVNLQGTALRQERIRSYPPAYSKQNNAFAKILGTEEKTRKTPTMREENGLERVGSSVSEEVKEAWEKAEKEAGMNGMAIDSSGKYTGLTELNVMSLLDIRKGRNGDVLGNTKQSAIEAVQKALGRLGIPENENEEKEKLFYEAFLRYLTPDESENQERTKTVSEDAIRNYKLSLIYAKNLEITKQELADEQITYLKEKYDVENISLEESSEVFEAKNVWWGGYAGKNDLPVEYTMYYAEDSTEENPILTATGKDEYGKAFERRIVIKEVNPRNATRIEMSALYEYYKPNEFFHHPFADNMGLDDRADFVACYQLYAGYSKGSYDIFTEYKGYADFLLGVMKENGIADIERAMIPTELNEEQLAYYRKKWNMEDLSEEQYRKQIEEIMKMVDKV